MVTFHNEPITKAIEASPYSKMKIAVLAEVAEPTLDKVINGDANLMLDSVERVADYLGFEVVVSFKEKSPAAEPLAA